MDTGREVEGQRTEFGTPQWGRFAQVDITIVQDPETCFATVRDPVAIANSLWLPRRAACNTRKERSTTWHSKKDALNHHREYSKTALCNALIGVSQPIFKCSCWDWRPQELLRCFPRRNRQQCSSQLLSRCSSCVGVAWRRRAVRLCSKVLWRRLK